jgi:anti-sigma-K factor RskA
VSTDQHVLELLPAYALSCLEQDDHVLVSEHLTACSSCQVELQAYQAVVDQLILATPQAVPPPELQSRLMQRLKASPGVRLSQPRTRWWQRLTNLQPRFALVWGAVSFILIVLLTASNLLLWQRLSQLETNSQPGRMRAIPLVNTNAAPGAAGFVIIGADGQNGALVVDRLPPLDSERQYQLWLIRDGQRTSGAVFSVDQNGYGGTRIKAPGSLFEYSACGISVEPAGGSSSPTGERVLSGLLN